MMPSSPSYWPTAAEVETALEWAASRAPSPLARAIAEVALRHPNLSISGLRDRNRDIEVWAGEHTPAELDEILVRERACIVDAGYDFEEQVRAVLEHLQEHPLDPDTAFASNLRWSAEGQYRWDITLGAAAVAALVAGYDISQELDPGPDVPSDAFFQVPSRSEIAPELLAAPASEIDGEGPRVEAERPPRRFEAVQVGELIRGQPPTWLVKGLLPEAALGIIYGASGSGKTFFAFDLVAAVARGVPWRERKVKQRRVMYICAEGVGGFRNRVAAYVRQFDVEFGDQLLVVPAAPDLLSESDVLDLTLEIQRADARVAVIDTLAQVTPGGDENSAVDMGKALKACREIYTETGALVILIHHSGKDSSRGARGWSGMRAAADFEIEVTRSLDSRVARISKLKDGEDGANFGFKLVPIVTSIDEDGDEITSCYVEPCSFADTSPVRRFGAKQRAVINALHDLTTFPGEGVATDEVLARTVEALPADPEKRDRRREHARRALNELIEQGVVGESEGRLRPAEPAGEFECEETSQ